METDVIAVRIKLVIVLSRGHAEVMPQLAGCSKPIGKCCMPSTKV